MSIEMASMAMPEKIVQRNSLLVSLYVFQYSLFMPLMEVIPPNLMVLMVSGLLILLLIIKNLRRFQFKKAHFIFLFFLGWLILLKCLLGSDPVLIFYGIGFSVSAVICFSVQIDYKTVLAYCYKLAYLNLIINAAMPWLPYYSRMRFGYALILTPLFIILNFQYQITKKRRLIDLTMVGLSLMLVFLYGGRGPFLTFIVFVIGYLFVFAKTHIAIIGIALAGLGTFVYYYIVEILELMSRIVNYLGIKSYSLNKYQMQLKEGLAQASSGRNILYQRAIDTIQENLMFGTDIFLDADHKYVHNLVLQVLQDFGIIGLVLLTVILFQVAYNIFNKRNAVYERLFLCALSSLAIGRLLVSSIYWKRPEFWLIIACSLALSAKHANEKQLQGRLIKLNDQASDAY